MVAAGRRVQVRLSDEQVARLQAIARARGVSVGSLIRVAVEETYLRPEPADRLAAVARMAELRLPVADPEQMERESAREPCLG